MRLKSKLKFCVMSPRQYRMWNCVMEDAMYAVSSALKRPILIWNSLLKGCLGIELIGSILHHHLCPELVWPREGIWCKDSQSIAWPEPFKLFWYETSANGSLIFMQRDLWWFGSSFIVWLDVWEEDSTKIRWEFEVETVMEWKPSKREWTEVHSSGSRWNPWVLLRLESKKKDQ